MQETISIRRRNRRQCAAPADFAPWIAALRGWLVVGSVAIAVLPEARGVDPWVGWLPFWLVVAPALDLVVLRRRRLARGASAWLARIARRRTWHRQARPLQRHGPRRRRAAAPPADAGTLT